MPDKVTSLNNFVGASPSLAVLDLIFKIYSKLVHLQVFCCFSKEDNFCIFPFASLDNKILPTSGLLLKEKICSYRSKFFSLRADP